MRLIFALGLAVASLTACGTPEQQQTRALCTAEWMEKIPPKTELRLVTNRYYELVPTGKSICVTEGNTTTCQDEMKRDWIERQEIEEVDLNGPERAAQIKACTLKQCLANYGNAECSTS